MRSHTGKPWLLMATGGLLLSVIVLLACGADATTSAGVSRTATSTASSGGTSSTPRLTSATAPRTAAPRYPGCHKGNPLAGVYSPFRLVLRSRCIRVHGVAGCIYVDHDDGDTHIALSLSPKEAKKYLTPGNRAWACDSDQASNTKPRLVVEVIPQHCRVLPDNCADRGHFTDPAIPANGQHITVTGPWVQDTSHYQGRTMWSEIHPAWRITFGLLCQAHVSDSTPKQYTTVHVRVRTRPHARVRTVAHYERINTAHRARAGRHGHARINYHIGRAKPGYTVKVGVTVRGPRRTGHCATAFTPHR